MGRRPAASRRLAVESLESRSMLSATASGLDAAVFTPHLVVCPFPVIINRPGDTVEPRIHIDPPIIDDLPIAIDPPIMYAPIVDGSWINDDPSALFEEYNAFLDDHPDWLSDHGADGIQLQVMTESAYVSGLFLSNPGTARAFDAWIEQAYLTVDGEELFVSIDDGSFEPDDECTDEPFIDGPCPVVDDRGFVIDAPDTEVRALAFSTLATDADRPGRQWMGQAVAFSPIQSADAAPAKPKRGIAAPVVRS